MPFISYLKPEFSNFKFIIMGVYIHIFSININIIMVILILGSHPAVLWADYGFVPKIIPGCTWGTIHGARDCARQAP